MSKRIVSITLDEDVFLMSDSLRNNRQLSLLINDLLRNFIEVKEFDLKEINDLKTEKEEIIKKLNFITSRLTALENKKKSLEEEKLTEMRNMAETFRRSGGINRLLKENAKNL